MDPETFRGIIAAAGLDQGQAADKLGVTRRTVVRWLSGETAIDKRNAAAIRAILAPKKHRR